MKSIVVACLLLLATPVFAQNQPQISPEQLYRQINRVLAQDNERLGVLVEQLQARIKEFEAKEEKK